MGFKGADMLFGAKGVLGAARGRGRIRPGGHAIDMMMRFFAFYASAEMRAKRLLLAYVPVSYFVDAAVRYVTNTLRRTRVVVACSDGDGVPAAKHQTQRSRRSGIVPVPEDQRALFYKGGQMPASMAIVRATPGFRRHLVGLVNAALLEIHVPPGKLLIVHGTPGLPNAAHVCTADGVAIAPTPVIGEADLQLLYWVERLHTNPNLPPPSNYATAVEPTVVTNNMAASGGAAAAAAAAAASGGAAAGGAAAAAAGAAASTVVTNNAADVAAADVAAADGTADWAVVGADGAALEWLDEAGDVASEAASDDDWRADLLGALSDLTWLIEGNDKDMACLFMLLLARWRAAAADPGGLAAMPGAGPAEGAPTAGPTAPSIYLFMCNVSWSSYLFEPAAPVDVEVDDDVRNYDVPLIDVGVALDSVCALPAHAGLDALSAAASAIYFAAAWQCDFNDGAWRAGRTFDKAFGIWLDMGEDAPAFARLGADGGLELDEAALTDFHVRRAFEPLEHGPCPAPRDPDAARAAARRAAWAVSYWLGDWMRTLDGAPAEPLHCGWVVGADGTVVESAAVPDAAPDRALLGLTVLSAAALPAAPAARKRPASRAPRARKRPADDDGPPPKRRKTSANDFTLPAAPPLDAERLMGLL